MSPAQAELEAKESEIEELKTQLQKVKKELRDYVSAAVYYEQTIGELGYSLDILRKDRDRLHLLINTPEIQDFQKAVVLESAHQRERWGSEHDEGKTDADWFWLIGYLAGKALNKPEKRLHHIITTAAACANWHAHLLGENEMRPGLSGEAQAKIEGGSK